MPKMNMVQAINLALEQEMKKDDSIILMGEDVGKDGGVFRVTDGLHDKFGEERVMDTPLAESGIMGTAIGMAIAGLKPVAEIQFSGFSHLIDAQLEGHATRYRSRTQGQRSVPLVVRMPYGGGVRALEHHSESRETLYAHLPGCIVIMPSSPRNARALMVSAIRCKDPVIYMEPKRSYRAFKEEVPEDEETIPIGKAKVLREGKDVTLVAWGAAVRDALKAADRIQEARGTSVELIDLLTISPMDGETIAASVRKTGRCVIVQEAPKTLGPAAEIVARLNEKSFDYLEAPVKRVSGFDVVTPYFGREHMYIPDAKRIVRAIEETLDWK